MKTLYPFIFFLILICMISSCEFSCAPVFEGGGRIHTTGSLVSTEGLPFSGVFIQIVGCNDLPYLHICEGDTYGAIAALGKSDVNGYFSVLHSENNSDRYRVVLNPGDNHSIQRSNDTIYDIHAKEMSPSDYQNFHLDLVILCIKNHFLLKTEFSPVNLICNCDYYVTTLCQIFSMITKIIQIGNSKGLRLSKTILAKYYLGDTVNIRLEENFIIIEPISKSREC